MEALAVLIGLSVILLVVVSWAVFMRVRRAPALSLQNQLASLSARLDAIAAVQADLPRALSDSRADQLADVSQQLASFARVVGGRIDSGQEDVGRRLADAAALISGVHHQLGQLSASTNRIEELGVGVNEVQQMLRVPKLRGTIGEIWLDEMLRQIIPVDLYESQYTFPSGERVDAVVHLGNQLLCIDAKFPLDACQRMLAANGNAADAERHRRAFHRSVRARIDEIARRYVRPDDGTFDFALMYVPAERVYHEAISSADQDLVGYALERRVVLASPNTLYAYLSAVLHGLRAFHVQRYAREVAHGISSLRLTLDKLVRVQDTIGRHIDHAGKQHDEAVRLTHGMNSQVASIPGFAEARAVTRPFVK